ncbi:capsular polysaccharide transport system permease protein [Paracoccus sulfuroxidans]|uniref:Capsular polysaccharide transport system permease protein n=2 Tax=Paracoccus sulfuroxidans TaxID=384678 RepID=A0A562NU46_9RHOB|nr:capsular polysaccharide transport system permease protein [Paracoccus sulfuroxidans]
MPPQGQAPAAQGAPAQPQQQRPAAAGQPQAPQGQQPQAKPTQGQPMQAQPMQAQAKPAQPLQAQPLQAQPAGNAVPVARPQQQPIPVRPVAQPVAQAVAQPVARPAPPQNATPIRPTVAIAQPRKRHWLLLISFIVIVVIPSILWGIYLWTRAEDQYVSSVGFSVHKEDSSPTIDLLGGLAPLAGGSGTTSDTDILYEYIRSQDMVEKIDEKLDLRARFSRDWPQDFVFAFNPAGHIEDLTDYWQRQVRVLYDTSTQLITLRISAFSPEDAQEIAQAVFDESSDKINELSAIAREDATRLAGAELEKARLELTTTRQAMTAFRMSSLIVDPQADLAGQMGVLSGLQAQLAEALVAHDLLLENARPTDHRVTQSQQKIDALRRLIDTERGKFGNPGQGPEGESYAQLMAEYEKLAVDREFAEGAYRAARVNYEAATVEAQRKSRYLAAHITPKIAQSSIEPARLWLLAMVAGLLLVGWSIMALVYYSIRDRS